MLVVVKPNFKSLNKNRVSELDFGMTGRPRMQAGIEVVASYQ